MASRNDAGPGRAPLQNRNRSLNDIAAALCQLYPRIERIDVEMLTQFRPAPIFATRFYGRMDDLAATMPDEIKGAFIEAVARNSCLDDRYDAVGNHWCMGRSHAGLPGDCFAYCFTHVDAPTDAEFYPRGYPSLRVQAIVERAIRKAAAGKPEAQGRG